jgi:Fe-S oxidoreductase
MKPGFLIPFAAGLAFLFFTLILYYVKWFRDIGMKNRVRMKQSISYGWLYTSLVEIFKESLLHLRIHKINKRLWYMHMSLAFGWFLLIVVGHMESVHHSGNFLSSPTNAVFLDYFTRGEAPRDGLAKVYNQLMDLLLLFILSGLVLAVFKRFRSRVMGYRRKPAHQRIDRIALTFLWLIFPARLVAESLNHAYYGGGGFATGFIGNHLPLPAGTVYLSDIAWWTYSIVLGGFFIALPFSRYMHILTELPHIFFKNANTYAAGDEGITSFHVNACSSCGICMNNCQLNESDHSQGQSLHFIRNYRRAGPVPSDQTMNCLLCGRCNIICPVKVDSVEIRMNERNRSNGRMLYDYSYLSNSTSRRVLPSTVAFFGGCMTRLTPGITAAMKKIFMVSGDDFFLVDEHDSICCGRPLQMSGQYEAYREMVNQTRQRILECQPSLLVTSCPICLHTFGQDYHFRIPVMHHSQYIDQLIMDKKIEMQQSGLSTVYHDPCELGRGLGIYKEPRRVIQRAAILENPEFGDELGYCCGNSLAELELEYEEKLSLARKAMNDMLVPGTEQLATSCPLCKKSFQRTGMVPVRDIAEIVADALVLEPSITTRSEKYAESRAH